MTGQGGKTYELGGSPLADTPPPQGAFSEQWVVATELKVSNFHKLGFLQGRSRETMTKESIARDTESMHPAERMTKSV